MEDKRIVISASNNIGGSRNCEVNGVAYVASPA